MTHLALSFRRATAVALALTGLIAASAYPQGSSAPGSWTLKAPLPSTWTEIVAVAFNDKLYAFSGGFPAKADVEVYDPATDKWQLLEPMPLGMDHIGTAVLDGKIYVVGGFTSNRHQQVNASVFEYNPAGDEWRQLASLSAPRGSVAAAAANGKIHAFGGRKNENDVVATHEVYDPKTNTWTPGPPLPRGRDHMAAVTVEGKIHVVGGRFGANEDSTGLHDIYDPATETWASGPLMPTPRGGGSGTFYRGMVVYLGGEDDKRAYNENEGFDVKANRWISLAPMPKPVHGIGVAAIGNTLYVAGGGQARGNREMTSNLMAFSLP
jgi:N-acetylneuraminic acid mutarotase